MSYLQPVQRPRVVMLDCTDELVASLTTAGYAVEAGYTGYFAEHPEMRIPAQLHEKDLLIIDLDPGWTPRPWSELYPATNSVHGPAMGDHAREPRLAGKPLERFDAALNRGAMTVVLMEGVTSPSAFDPNPSSMLRGGLFGWLPGAPMLARMGYAAGLRTTDLSDDQLKIATETLIEAQEGAEADEHARFVVRLLDLLRSHPEARSLRTLTGCNPLLVNDADEAKAGYVVAGNGGPGVTLLLPYFQRKSAVLHRLLDDLLPEMDPEMFPPRQRTAWHGDDAYQVPAVQELRRQRAELRERLEREVDQLDAAEQHELRAGKPFTTLITGREQALREAVGHALDWLGFTVVDADADNTARGVTREEDFRISDGDGWLSCVEVMAAQGNARQKDYGDLRTYMDIRRRDPRFASQAISGLLIVNQQWRDEPATRNALFSTDGRDWDAAAMEDGVTIIDTWTLFRLCSAILAGDKDAAEVRSVLKEGGLVSAP
jgi:hypothetical protein